jgi:hypothetical protein
VVSTFRTANAKPWATAFQMLGIKKEGEGFLPHPQRIGLDRFGGFGCADRKVFDDNASVWAWLYYSRFHTLVNFA